MMAKQKKQSGLSQTTQGPQALVRSELTSGFAMLLSLMIGIPTIILLLYVSGVWSVMIENGQVIRDTTDDIVLAGAFFDCIFAWIIIGLHSE